MTAGNADIFGIMNTNAQQSDVEHLNRMRAAMVLFRLEQALGAYVTENTHEMSSLPPSVVREIERRNEGSDDRDAVHAFIQSTYLSEIIDVAVAVSQQSSDNPHLERLRELVVALRVYDIRNAVCHPNRPFPECYWYAMATIATDSAIQILQLRSVVDAFRQAERGTIEKPPDDWLAAAEWEVPNNLPSTLDHDITGLIGRSRETADLLKKLSNPRFPLIAIVGPGGTGKTALCLDALHQCRHDPSTLRWAEHIVYVTAKTERLTVSGVERIADPVDSIRAVESAVVDGVAQHSDELRAATFGEVCRHMSARRVLLCIDNLETLLRDNPAEFEHFHADLPNAWRVLVTSRVPINSATVIPVDALTSSAGKKLARDYIARRGGGKVEESLIERVANACDGNPLGIRLLIDTRLAGVDLEDALRKTRDNIIAFSYANLVDAIPKEARVILECLFASGIALSRSDIAHLTDLGLDEIALGIASLARTSLVSRESTETSEVYGLSSSVRELLLRRPIDESVRQQVHSVLKHAEEVRVAIASSPRRDPLCVDFIPTDLSPLVKTSVFDAFRALRSRCERTRVLRALDGLRGEVSAGREVAGVVLRAMGRLFLELADRHSAIEHLQRAVECPRGDAAAQLLLAELFQSDRRLEESASLSEELLKAGWLSEESGITPSSRGRLLKVHWVVAIWLGRWRDAIAASERWREAKECRVVLGCINVSAKKRRLEEEKVPEVVELVVSDLLETVAGLVATDGYVGSVAHEGLNALGEIARIVRQREVSPGCAAAICAFVDDHVPSMCAVHNERALDDPQIVDMIRVFQSLECGAKQNVLRRERWVESLDEASDPALSEYGYITVEVYHRPKDTFGALRDYLFARDSDGQEYYVRQRVSNLDSKEFAQVKIGDRVSVRPAEYFDEGKAIPVQDAVF